MNEVMLVSVVQRRALEALTTYRFLTRELMQLAGVGRDRKNLQTALDALWRKGWIGRTETKPLPDVGRLPRLYFLRPAGAEAIAALFGGLPPKTVKNAPTLAEELPHRLAIIKTHILLAQWARTTGATLDWFTADYGPGRARDLKATGIPYEDEEGRKGIYTPDALAQVTLADGRPRLLVVEVYQGGRGGTLKHFREKVGELRTVCANELVEEQLGNPHGARFLVLFKDAVMRDAALKNWPDRSAEEWGQFFVKAMDELRCEFAGSWWRPGQLATRQLF